MSGAVHVVIYFPLYFVKFLGVNEPLIFVDDLDDILSLYVCS